MRAPRLRDSIALFALATAVTATAQEPVLRGLDPVRLCAGKEEAGKPELTFEHAGATYRFASEETRTAFIGTPDRYGIQLGGACARMGPLSGAGNPQRFHVHGERIYVFASDQCRDAFKKAPDAYLAVDDPRPTPDAATAAAGNELVLRAATAHGGKERLLALRTLAWQRGMARGDTMEVVRTSVQLPDSVRVDQEYRQGDNVWRYARVMTPTGRFFVNQGKASTMPAVAEHEALRELQREPLVALRQVLDGRAIAVPAGKREVLGIAVDEVAIWFADSITTLGLDAEGRVRTARFRGRGGSLAFGAVELAYDDLQTHAGVLVPTAVRANFDGKDNRSLYETRSQIVVDGELPAGVFTAPK